MKVSLNTVKQFIDFDLPPIDELVARINSQLGGVEEVIDLGAKYKDATIVKVVECEKHPNADRLNVCQIDAGTGALVQVVCGAPNVKPGMWAVWLPPESIVPSTFDDAEPFVLGARELRGVMSHGMLAAGDELAVNSDHEGIIEINPDERRPYDVKIEPGLSFAQVYGLDDTIIDIENKMFTHRPDLFGQLGVAREIAGIFGHKFTSPSWYRDEPRLGDGDGLALETFHDAGDKVPRIMFAAMKDVTIKPSPLWLQCALVAMGGKPINNIVDVTNYVMLLTAQPTHAYDYDKLRGGRIGTRMAESGEKITLLNDKTYELTSDDIVIADGEGPIGLGGIMGGGDSDVDENTKNIVLEVATFDMYAVRKSAMRHGVFTDALTRFNKGQSPFQNDRVMNLLIRSVHDVSGAEQAGKVFDVSTASGEDDRWSAQTIETEFINQRLGISLTDAEMVAMLENVEFDAHDLGLSNAICLNAPFWRTDIELPEDVVEEIGRLYGFDKLPRELPARTIAPAPHNTTREVARKVRESMKRMGANEVLTYSFVHENILKKSGQNPDEAYRLGNALSPDLQYYRLSILPSILDKTYGNIRAGYHEFLLYEIGKAHQKGELNEEELPKEFDRIAGVYASKRTASQAPYYVAVAFVRQLVNDFNASLQISFQKLSEFDARGHRPFGQLVQPFDPERSSVVLVDGALMGVVGEFKSCVLKNFKLPENSAGFELFPSTLEKLQAAHGYTPLSRFPSVSQDLSFRGDSSVSYAAIHDLLTSQLEALRGPDLMIVVTPLAIYVGDNTSLKTTTFRVTFTDYERTLTDAAVKPLVDAAADALKREYSLELV